MQVSPSGSIPNNSKFNIQGQTLHFQRDQVQINAFLERGQNHFKPVENFLKAPERIRRDRSPRTFDQKSCPNLEFDSQFFKGTLTDYNATLKTDNEKNIPRKTSNAIEKARFLETQHPIQLQGNVTINHFPKSTIGMKRAMTPLIHSNRMTPSHATNFTRENTSETQFRLGPRQTNLLNNLTSELQKRSLDETPPLDTEDLGSDFSMNFEKALEIHRFNLNSPQKTRTEDNSFQKSLAFFSEEKDTNFPRTMPSTEDSVKRFEKLKNLSFETKGNNSKSQQYFGKEMKNGINSRESKRTSDFIYKTPPQTQPNSHPEFSSKKTDPSIRKTKTLASSNNSKEASESTPLIRKLFQFTFFKRSKCSCDSNLKDHETCSKAYGWIGRKYKKTEFAYLKSTYEKILFEKTLLNQEYAKQIQKDINRTYPNTKLYAADSEGVRTLERILNTFAKYDPQIGYVQGMNFIAASLLYHAEEYLAFWLLVMIFEIFEMRDIYLPKLPGLSKHCQIVDILIFNYQHSLYTHLCKNGIKVEMFCSEWIFALFASVIPVENMVSFYDKFLEDGWSFFYRLILAFLQQFDKMIKQKSDFAEIMTILKSQNHITKQKSNGASFTIDWDNLFQKAQKIEIDCAFIYKMHTNFDASNQWFRASLAQ